MTDPQEQKAGGEDAAVDPASEEIARSLGSVWQRFSGARPKSTSVEIERDVVRCVIEEGTPEPDGDEDGAADDGPALSPDSPGFNHNATAAIARVTGRRVIAFIPKRDKKTHISTQTFILDRPRQKF
jgi:hypothetical protein